MMFLNRGRASLNVGKLLADTILEAQPSVFLYKPFARFPLDSYDGQSALVRFGSKNNAISQNSAGID